MTIFLVVIATLVLAVYLFMQQPKFGARPSGSRLQRIQNSPNYKNGAFQNLSDTPQLAEDTKMTEVLYKFFFGKSKLNVPVSVIPTQKNDLKNLSKQENIVVWFGHSSYFIQADGKTLLADPVFSGNASPIGNVPAYKGSDAYSAEDMPDIDFLFLSHDHWDHLDYKTVKQLLPKVKRVITGLGTGAHLECWGYSPEIITELDWHESATFNDFIFIAQPARHFSGRGFKRNGTLFISAVWQTPSFRLYLGGDSGYDTHFERIGKEHGPFDLAILECGQYNHAWKYIHMMPEETATAARLLGAKTLLPVHWAKFSLALHDWDDSIKRVTTAAQNQQQPIVTPMIGEKIYLDKLNHTQHWWNGLQ
ncbi:MBL fold metallo-hydrolase [Flavobacterium sp. RNTU_13]|uniref:MBL fold metallo-hydrolase n=1 Tax=Flavobacterium sp. RNTU_13 TaxID=3375145 RepID=UPI0039872DB8